MTFISGMWFHTFSKTVFKTVVKNVITYFTTVFKTVVKNVLDRQTLIFTVANFSQYEKHYYFSNNCSENARIWGTLAAPDFANSGKKACAFPDVNSNSREKCIEYIFHDCFQNSREKCIGSPNPYIYRCKFFSIRKTLLYFKKLQRERPHTRDTGGSWLRQ